MGVPSGPARDDAGRGDGGDDYRTPLLPGAYPPLGYSPAGQPRYTPADLAVTRSGSSSPVGYAPPPGLPSQPGLPQTGLPQTGAPQTGAPPQTSMGGPPPLRADAGSSGGWGEIRRALGIDSAGRTAIATLVVVGCVAVVLLAVAIRSLGHDDQQEVLPPVPITDYGPAPTNPGLPIPTDPGTEDAPGAPTGQTVTYRVTIDGSATILYVDDQGVGTNFTPPPTWTLDFTATGNPLRLLVVAGAGSAAQCSISVGGHEVAADQVQAQSTRRTATCIA